MEKKKIDKKTIIIISVVVAVLIAVLGFVFLFNGKGAGSVESVSAKIESEYPYSKYALQDLDSAKETEEQKVMSVDLLKNALGLNPEDIAAYKGKLPLMNVKASMYLVVEAKDGKVDEVYNKIVEYGNNYGKQWERYLQDQYELVQRREVKKEGNIVYIVVPTEEM